jgi:hypothetical protein
MLIGQNLKNIVEEKNGKKIQNKQKFIVKVGLNMLM